MSNGSNQRFPGKGRRAISDAPGSNYGEKWYQQLDQLDKPKVKTKPKELRIVGGTFTINQHYVKFNKKGGGTTGYYELCLNFDPISSTFKKGDDAICPICRDFSDPDMPKDLQMFGTFRYYVDAFDLDKVKAGVHDGCFGVLWTNKYGKNDWVKIAGSLGCDVDDLVNGCTVFWYFDEHAKDNKDKMSFMKGEKLPVLYNEKKNLYGIKTAAGIFTGSPTPYETIILPKAASEIERDLHRLGHYARLEEYLKGIKGGYHPDETDTRPSSRTSSSPEEPPAKDEDFTQEEPPAGRSFGKSSVSSDDSWETEGASSDDGFGTEKAEEPSTQKPKGSGKKAAPKQETLKSPDADDGWDDPPAKGNDKHGKAKPSTTPPDSDFSDVDLAADKPESSDNTSDDPMDDGWE